MNKLMKFGLILGVICLIATLILAVTYEVTKPKIEAQLREEENAALKIIMPDADAFTPKTIGEFNYFEAYKGGRLIGYSLKITGMGYGGYIRMIAGIDPDGIIKGVSVLEHQETPGLGSQIAEARRGEDKPRFLKQFAGKNAQTLAVKENIDAITGATISSKAVTDAIREAVTGFLEEINEGRGE